jgi:putative nucleotidyltransferase with HDIG domain
MPQRGFRLIHLKQLPDGQRQVLRAVMVVLASWDAELFAHSEQVARELVVFAPAGQEEAWYWAGLLHDIGKISVPFGILHKRSGLSRRERKAMQQHSLKGVAILRQIGAPQVVVHGAKFHHERWDGTGYPYDVGGEQIPFVARALAVADVYTALTSDRPYRGKLSSAQACAEIERNAGSQFDPDIVARFLEGKSNATG